MQGEETLVIGFNGEKPLAPGSMRFRCHYCSFFVWLAPSSQRAYSRGAICACEACATARTAAVIDVKYGVAEGGAAEMAAARLVQPN